jgi:HNH endonuclease
MKKCGSCRQLKDFIAFGKNRATNDGFHCYCKECVKIIDAEWRRDNPEKWENQKIRNKIKYRKKFGIPLDKPFKRKRGEPRLNYRGYMEMRGKKWENHPCADKFGRILEHRLIMFNHLGRDLREGENIHHKNGDRTDNRIENLELWATKHPPGQRLEDKISWCKEFLTEYGYHVTKK